MPRILITEPGKNPQPFRFDIDIESVKIGRAGDNEIGLECGSISSHHAEMVRAPGEFRLNDLGSTNGITRDGEPVEHVALADGDHLLLGDVGFEFQLSADEAAILAAEVDDADAPEPEAEPPRNRPAPRAIQTAASPPQRPTVAPPPSSGIGAMPVFIFLILAAVAFWFGMSMRHKNATGIPLGQAMKHGDPPPATATEDPPAPENSDVFEAGKDEPQEPPPPVVQPPEIEEVPEGLEGWDQRDRGEVIANEVNAEEATLPDPIEPDADPE